MTAAASGARHGASLAGKVALVTGSSRGIGAAIARVFARAGARVVIHGRDVAAMEAVRAGVAADGGEALCVAADVTRFEEVEAMRHRIEDALGPIDVLVANAGGAHAVAPLEQTTTEDWRASIDLNLTATFHAIKSVLPGMKARRTGSIVTMASTAGHVPHPRAPVGYSAAQAGIEILTRVVAAEAGPFGVRVNAVAPGTILTERNERRIPEPMKAELAALHPLRRLGTPEDVAHAAAFLASDAAGWITGIVLEVAGGGTIASARAGAR